MFYYLKKKKTHPTNPVANNRKGMLIVPNDWK